MALFTDGTIARIDDLRAHESSVLDLTSTEGIDVSAKLSLAQRELGTEMIPILARRGYRDLSQVVVTDALLSAHAARTLAMIYRDLYQSRFNDRYEGKWREYAAQSDRAMKALLEAGVGITLAPIAKAAEPVVETVSGGMLPGRTYYVRIAWTRGFQVTGAPSEAVSVALPPASKLNVQAPQAPQGVKGVLIYAGESPDGTTLQKESPLAADEVWTEPDSGLRLDLAKWPVQGPDLFVENRREILRG